MKRALSLAFRRRRASSSVRSISASSSSSSDEDATPPQSPPKPTLPPPKSPSPTLPDYEDERTILPFPYVPDLSSDSEGDDPDGGSHVDPEPKNDLEEWPNAYPPYDVNTKFAHVYGYSDVDPDPEDDPVEWPWTYPPYYDSSDHELMRYWEDPKPEKGTDDEGSDDETESG